MAAFNLKENIEATVDRVTVHDSEIAFRVRGPTRQTPAGARVTVMNAVIYEVATAFRYENDIEVLRIWNSTLGRSVERPFRAAASNRAGLDVQNLLVLGPRPPEAERASNLSVGPAAFIDTSKNFYMPTSEASPIDAGVVIPAVVTDRDGRRRPIGRAYDVGAFESGSP
jgi:hypothetical protein